MEGEVVTEWNRIVKSVTVSSKYGARFDLPGSVWQSNGSQGKHWIRLEILPNVIIKSLKVGVDPSDNSYMPSLIVVNGKSLYTMQKLSFIYTVRIKKMLFMY